MEALLGLGRDDGSRNRPCGSAEELQLQLTSLLETKVLPTKAEHLSETFELRQDAVFAVSASDNEGDAPESSEHVGPAMATRQIRAIDTVMNQPQDDPVLQTAVAKHIAGAIGQIDGSAWAVRQVSRASAGWTFTYQCKESLPAWKRQNAKNSARTAVALSSGKDGQDPANLSRPAFDCGGSLTIGFVWSSKLITVKYEHTPFHRTVGQLMDFFTPPPPPPTPSKRQADEVQSGEGSKKKRKKSQADGAPDGQGSSPRKRKKNSHVLDAAMTASELPADGTAAAPGAQTTPRATKPRKPRSSKKGTPRKGSAAQPDGAVQGGQEEAQQGDPAAQASAYAQSLLNLPPGEATRRREVAFKILTDAKIDPQTLSEEQINIFANQSPDLQKESLAMLVKYGAERLRIVHPNKDSASASASPPAPVTPAKDAAAATQSPAGASGETTSAKKKKKRARKQVADGNGGNAAEGTPKQKQTRGSCDSCKLRRLKCPKEKPECSECRNNGLACVYGPPRVRNKPAAQLADEVAPSAEEAQEEPAVEQEEEEASDLGSPGFSHASGLALPQAAPADVTQQAEYGQYSMQQTHLGHSGDGLSYPAQSQPAPGFPYHHDTPVPAPHVPTQPGLSYHDTTVAAPPPAEQPRGARAPASGSRRSLPSEPSGQSQAARTAATTQGATTAWSGLPATNSQVASTASPTMTQQTAGRQSRTRKSASTAVSYETHQAYDRGLQQPPAHAGAAVQQPAQPAPAARMASPFQATAQASRAKSRQGHRSQNRTSAGPNASSTYQETASSQSPATGHASYSASAGAETGSGADYDAYPRYSTNAAGSQPGARSGYEPYSNQSSNASSYPTYDGYGTRSHAAPTPTAANPVTQSMSSSYNNTSTAPSAPQWSGASHRNAHSYPANDAGSTSPPYSLPQSSAQPSQSLQPFNVRPQRTAPQARSSTTDYSQQPHQSYSSYSAQPQGSSSQQQSSWYGFAPANSTSSNYESGSRGTSTGAYGQNGSGNSASYQQQQHRAMNLTGHTYSSMENEELYNLLHNGSGH